MKSRYKRRVKVENARSWLHSGLADLVLCNYLFFNLLSAVIMRTLSVQSLPGHTSHYFHCLNETLLPHSHNCCAFNHEYLNNSFLQIFSYRNFQYLHLQTKQLFSYLSSHIQKSMKLEQNITSFSQISQSWLYFLNQIVRDYSLICV